MLQESSNRPSAIRKYKNNTLIDTKEIKLSAEKNKNNLSRHTDESTDDLRGSNTMKFFEGVNNGFEPIENELKRIREILDKEK